MMSSGSESVIRKLGTHGSETRKARNLRQRDSEVRQTGRNFHKEKCSMERSKFKSHPVTLMQAFSAIFSDVTESEFLAGLSRPAPQNATGKRGNQPHMVVFLGVDHLKHPSLCGLSFADAKRFHQQQAGQPRVEMVTLKLLHHAIHFPGSFGSFEPFFCLILRQAVSEQTPCRISGLISL